MKFKWIISKLLTAILPLTFMAAQLVYAGTKDGSGTGNAPKSSEEDVARYFRSNAVPRAKEIFGYLVERMGENASYPLADVQTRRIVQNIVKSQIYKNLLTFDADKFLGEHIEIRKHLCEFNGKPAEESVNWINGKPVMCFSTGSLSRLTPKVLDVELTGILMHAFVHAAGDKNEKRAQYFQDYVKTELNRFCYVEILLDDYPGNPRIDHRLMFYIYSGTSAIYQPGMMGATRSSYEISYFDVVNTPNSKGVYGPESRQAESKRTLTQKPGEWKFGFSDEQGELSFVVVNADGSMSPLNFTWGRTYPHDAPGFMRADPKTLKVTGTLDGKPVNVRGLNPSNECYKTFKR